jgi:DHA2 family multidrug resistance protein
MTIPRGITLVGGLVLMSFVPARIDNRLFVTSGMALVTYANWRMLSYSPEMDWWPVALVGLLQGAGLAILMPALSKMAFATLDPKFLWQHDRHRGSPDLLLQQHPGDASGARQESHAL